MDIVCTQPVLLSIAIFGRNLYACAPRVSPTVGPEYLKGTSNNENGIDEA